MKSAIRSCFAVLAAMGVGLVASAKTTTWQGGSGRFSDDNWDNGTPATGDIILITNTVAGAVITNDCVGLSLASIQFRDGCKSLTLTGEDIKLTATPAIKMYTKDYTAKIPSAVFDIGLAVERSGGTTMALNNPTFKKPVTVMYNGTPQPVTFDPAAGTAAFNGGFTAGNPTCWSNFGIYCHDVPVHLGAVTAGSGCSFSFYLYEGTQGSTFSSYSVNYYGLLGCYAKNVMPTNLVLRFGLNTIKDGWGTASNSRYIINADQTGDRIVGEAPMLATDTQIRNQHHINTESGSTATLTLRGTDDATCFAQTTGALSLVWDPTNDYAQTFCDRKQLMTGSITVKGGTFRSAGTNNFASVPTLNLLGGTFEVASSNVACLAALTTLNVRDGGAFRMTADANVAPWAANRAVTVTLRNGGKLELAAGTTMSAAVLSADGYYPPAGTYTGKDYADAENDIVGVDWIEGAGRVTVANTGYVCWKEAKDGAYDEPSNWTTGTVPGAGDIVCLTLKGAAYTVTKQTAGTMPARLIVGNAQGAATFKMAADATVAGTTLQIDEGGEVEIADDAVVTWTGLVQVGEDVPSSRKATFRVSGGVFTNTPPSATVGFKIKKDGRFVMTDGVFVSDYTQAQTTSSFFNEGGEVLVSGGTFGPAAKGTTHDADMIYRMSGSADFSGGTFLPNGTVNFFPVSATEPSDIVFRDAARWSAKTLLRVGGERGTARLSILTEVSKGDAYANRWSHRNRVGYNGGTGYLTVSNISMYLSQESFHVGSMWNAPNNDGAKGYVEIQKDCVIKVDGEGSRTKDWTGGFLQGLEVGYGGYTGVTSGRPFYGEMTVRTGGRLENHYGDTVFGTGYGEGHFLVDGGKFWSGEPDSDVNRAKRYFSLGTAGGLGTATFRNGADVLVYCNAHIAGPHRLAFVQGSSVSSPGDGLSEGTMTVEDATVKLRRGLVIGADGFGTCAVVGSVGSFTLLGDLVLTNVASVATSGSCLSFRADANGIKPIVSTGALTIRDNAKLTVDLSAYEGTRSKLKILSCASHTGDFADVSVVWKSTDKNTGIEWIGNDLYAVRPGRGLVVIVR